MYCHPVSFPEFLEQNKKCRCCDYTKNAVSIIQVTGSTKMNEIEELKNTIKQLTSRIEDLESILKDQLPFKNLKNAVFKPEPKLMDFSDALKAMKEGKKVNIKRRASNRYIWMKDNIILDEIGMRYSYLESEWITSIDWYIVE